MDRKLNLYEVTNGYVGYNYLHAIVVAETEEQAFGLARESYKASAKYGRYPEKYYEDLDVELLAKDVSNGYSTKVYE